MNDCAREGNVVWTWNQGVQYIKYDELAFYRRQFHGKSGGDAKAVDFVVIGGTDSLWLIEAKDYTFESRDDDKADLWVEAARKARDTLAGLRAAAANAENEERSFAVDSLRPSQVRLVLHLEQPANPNRKYGKILDLRDVQAKLRRIAKAIDPHALVVDCNTPPAVPWTARWNPEGATP